MTGVMGYATLIPWVIKGTVDGTAVTARISRAAYLLQHPQIALGTTLILDRPTSHWNREAVQALHTTKAEASAI